MKLDNLFVVESPLQALVALELAESFRGKKNGIYYRLCGEGRERNDLQIRKVVELGEWCFKHEVRFDQSNSYSHHQSVRKFVLQESHKFSKVGGLFFGEFRSHWMHIFRMAMPAKSYVLLDDGAASLTVKHAFIDKGNYFPADYFYSSQKLVKKLAKVIYYKYHYRDLYDEHKRCYPVEVASAFLKEESNYKVDFSSLRERFLKPSEVTAPSESKAYFFGSKYSEAGIISLGSELELIKSVVDYHKSFGLSTIYCSHRDESPEKLDYIQGLGCENVISPDVPAELFLLERHEEVAMISAAYSSVINNLRLVLPGKEINSFVLKEDSINEAHRVNIKRVYKYYEEIGVNMIAI